MEQLEMEHAYRTMLDMHAQVENGRGELIEWMGRTMSKKLYPSVVIQTHTSMCSVKT